MSKREIPKKNYYILALLLIGVVVITFAITNILNNIKNNKINSGYINKYVSEIQYKELDAYLLEPASNTFIYLTITGNEDVYKLEKSLKKLINNYELGSNFIYIDLSDEMVNRNFLDKVNNKFNINAKNLPIILYYRDGVLIDTILSDNKVFNVADFQKLLDNYEIAS